MQRTAVINTPFTIVISKTEQNIEIVGSLLWSPYAASEFAKDTKEIQALFKFIEENKKSLFKELGFHGVLL